MGTSNWLDCVALRIVYTPRFIHTCGKHTTRLAKGLKGHFTSRTKLTCIVMDGLCSKRNKWGINTITLVLLSCIVMDGLCSKRNKWGINTITLLADLLYRNGWVVQQTQQVGHKHNNITSRRVVARNGQPAWRALGIVSNTDQYF